MMITKLKSKIHRVTVTETNLRYEGSCAIDKSLLDASWIQEHEMIHIYNVNSGDRFTTYAIAAESESGIISVRGSAARKAMVGDILIICTYAQYSPDDESKVIVVYVDDKNNQI